MAVTKQNVSPVVVTKKLKNKPNKHRYMVHTCVVMFYCILIVSHTGRAVGTII